MATIKKIIELNTSDLSEIERAALEKKIKTGERYAAKNYIEDLVKTEAEKLRNKKKS